MWLLIAEILLAALKDTVKDAGKVAAQVVVAGIAESAASKMSEIVSAKFSDDPSGQPSLAKQLAVGATKLAVNVGVTGVVNAGVKGTRAAGYANQYRKLDLEAGKELRKGNVDNALRLFDESVKMEQKIKDLKHG
jgi:hypothetical protein